MSQDFNNLPKEIQDKIRKQFDCENESDAIDGGDVSQRDVIIADKTVIAKLNEIVITLNAFKNKYEEIENRLQTLEGRVSSIVNRELLSSKRR